MTGLLKDYLPWLVLAPQGIDCIRELILELAVKGRLVSQGLGNQNASILLNEVRAGMNDHGKVEPHKSIGESERPFALPSGWEWARLGSFSRVKGGKRLPSGTSFSHQPTPFVYIRITDMKNGTVCNENFKYISPEVREAIKNYTISSDDLYITIAGTIGNVGTVPDELDGMNLTENAAKIVFTGIERDWLLICLQSRLMQSQFKQKTNQQAQPKLALHRIANSVIAMPPLEEQRRIVSKVRQLMNLCNQLEAQAAASELAHRRLISTQISVLFQSADQSDFDFKWNQIKNNFELFLSTEQSIAEFRNMILQLAVMGKLVPSMPSEDKADALLQTMRSRIAPSEQMQKSRLRQRLSAEKTKDFPFEIPRTWKWTRIDSICTQFDYGLSVPTFETRDGVPVLKMGDIQGGKVILGNKKKTDTSTDGLPNLFLKKGDLLYNRTNSAELVGKTGIYEGEDDQYTFASYLIRMRCDRKVVDPYYLNLAMLAPYFRQTQINPLVKQQCGQANVNGTLLRGMLLPLPPLGEQLRIVRIVTELLELCENLTVKTKKAQLVGSDIAARLIAVV